MSETAGHALLLVTLLLVAVGGAGAFGQPLAQVDIDADSVELHPDVQADGDARWTVVYRIRLDDENATAAFEQLQSDIESNPATYLDPFRQRMERTAAGAENATGRDMAIRNLSVETRTDTQPQVTYGIVTYSFTWTNFAAVDGDTLSVGDAIDQLFLDSKTSLRVTWPDSYVVDSRTPDPTRSDGTELVWQGQQSFDPGEPRIVLVPEGETPAGTPTGTPGGTVSPGGTASPTDTAPPGTETPAAGGGGLPVMPLLVVVVLVLVSGAWVVSRGDITLPTDETGDEASAAGATTASGDGDDGPPPELLSNEERVLQLLEQNGGRMKQKEVAEQLDWTAAKTSQVVGDLRDGGKLDSFRLGRENVLTLPDVDVDGGSDASGNDAEN